MFKGKFKTAWMQRELPENAVVIGDMVVGELVKVTPAVGEVPAIIEKLTADIAGSAPTPAELAAALEEADAIMAQSDMTLDYGHVPVENRDYKYVADIAETVDSDKLEPASGKTGAIFVGYTDTKYTDEKIHGVDGDTALYYDATNKKFVKQVLTVGGTAQAPTYSWADADSDAAYSIALNDAMKQTARFNILNRKNDIIVYDGE